MDCEGEIDVGEGNELSGVKLEKIRGYRVQRLVNYAFSHYYELNLVYCKQTQKGRIQGVWRLIINGRTLIIKVCIK